MEKDRIIHQGDTAKFQVIIQHEDFDQQTDLNWGIPDQCMSIDRLDMISDE